MCKCICNNGLCTSFHFLNNALLSGSRSHLIFRVSRFCTITSGHLWSTVIGSRYPSANVRIPDSIDKEISIRSSKIVAQWKLAKLIACPLWQHILAIQKTPHICRTRRCKKDADMRQSCWCAMVFFAA